MWSAYKVSIVENGFKTYHRHTEPIFLGAESVLAEKRTSIEARRAESTGGVLGEGCQPLPPARGLGSALSSPAGWTEPQPKLNLVHVAENLASGDYK